MSVQVLASNASARKGLYRSDALRRLAMRICAGESVDGDVEVSVLFCDDEQMSGLNAQYRGKNKPTDVLSFPQPDSAPQAGADAGVPRVLGDIVISLETVARTHGPDTEAMRAEVRLLFCHGMLHLLGYDHVTPAEERGMQAKQAHYLEVEPEAAWRGSTGAAPQAARRARGGAR